MTSVWQAGGRRVTAPKVIECPCGYTLRGEDDPSVVAAAQRHAAEVHGQELSEEQALSMARPG
jgi:predicted small metal-binding protein